MGKGATGNGIEVVSNAVTPKVKFNPSAANAAIEKAANSSVIAKTTSFVGDVFRGVTNSFTDGHFGNGNAAQRDGETTEEYLNRLAQAGGAAAEVFNNTVTKPSNSDNMADSLKTGVTSEAVKSALMTYLPIVVIGGVGFWAVKKFILKKGGKRRSY